MSRSWTHYEAGLNGLSTFCSRTELHHVVIDGSKYFKCYLKIDLEESHQCTHKNVYLDNTHLGIDITLTIYLTILIYYLDLIDSSDVGKLLLTDYVSSDKYHTGVVKGENVLESLF